MVHSRYNKFFSIQLLHEYFKDQKCFDFDMVPAADTNTLFNGLHIEWRKQENEFKAYIKVNEQGAPFINHPSLPPPNDKIYRSFSGRNIFRIYLKLKNSIFPNYTNINFSRNSRFYFSNITANNRNNILYISSPVTDFANGLNYIPGDLAMEAGTDNVFEVITKHVGAPATFKTAGFWVSKGALQFPTANDQVETTTGIYSFQLPAAVNVAEIQFFSFDFNLLTPGYTVPACEKEEQKFSTGNERDVITIDLKKLKPGKYKINVNGIEKMIYYDPEFIKSDIVGVIEIFNHLPGNSPYSFLDANEIINAKQYTIQFGARRVLWKYIRKDAKADAITDTAGNLSFQLHGDDFVSEKPVQFTEVPVATLELTFANANPKPHKLAPLPNPSFEQLGKFTQSGYDYLCSEMFLNY